MSALSPSPYRRLSQAASPILTPKKGDPTPTVFVKLTGDDEYIPKKILIPRKISQLLENCIKILQDPNLKSVLDDRGFLIESCRDIEPGSVLTITPIDPAFCPRDPKRKIRSPDIAKNVSTPKEDDENAEANAALQEKKRKEEKKRKKEEERKRKEEEKKKALLEKKRLAQIEESRAASMTSSLSPSITKKRKIATMNKIDMRKISRPPSSSDDDDDDDPRADLASMSTKLTAFLAQHEENSSDEESEELRRHREEKRQRKLLYQSVVTIQDEKNLPFQQIIEEIIPPQDAPRLLEDGLDLIAKDRKEFIQKTSDIEGEHIYIWITGAADQPFLKRYPMQPYHDPITSIVTNFLTKHRHICNKQYTYRFKGAVLGPKRSGKSTLLGNAVDNYIIDLAATGLWKSTFILAIDFKILAPLVNHYEEFYYKFLDIILDAISKQKPVIRPDLPAIKRQMKSAIENRAPLVGVHPYREMDIIAKHINEAWRSYSCFTAYLTHVCMLPITLARAVGLTNVSLFVDNIEYADVTLYPHEPFDRRDTQAIFIEHIKYALSHANFILSAENSEKLFHILPPFDEDGVDLASGMDYILPYEATVDLGSRLKYDFLIECLEEPEAIRINIGMCAGIVPYISAWDELHHSLFVLERTSKDSEQYDEVKYTCVADAQTLIDTLFICDNSKKITVSGVKRDKKGNDIHLRLDDTQSIDASSVMQDDD